MGIDINPPFDSDGDSSAALAAHTGGATKTHPQIDAALGLMTATPGEGKSPLADGGGKLDAWISAATQALVGLARFATADEAIAAADSGLIISPATQFAAARFKGGSFTRDLTAASGTQEISGVGFQPKAILFFCGIAAATSAAASIGFYEANANINAGLLGMYYRSAGAWWSAPSGQFAQIETANGNYQTARVSALGADGFTVMWVKAGGPTGTATISFLAFR